MITSDRLIWKCMECGALLANNYTQHHFNKIHRSEDGAPLWEQGYSQLVTEGDGCD